MQFVEIGEILDDRYKIESKLGAGGMGTVYKADDLIEDREIAIKVLSYRGTVGESEGRFRREFRAISRCKHPHVVSVYDFGSNGEILYIVMEYIEGSDLRGHLIRKLRNKGISQFNLAEFIEIFIQVCDALDFIHSQKIIHRDIKPENILIDRDHNAKIMDFGLSRVLDVSSYITKTGEIMGTAAYISPEQGRGEKVGYWSDIYSLGVVMFEAVTGRLPFSGTNPIALVFQHIQELPMSPRTFNPGIPDKLEKIIMKTLQKDPFERHQRASEIIDDLKNLADEASSSGEIDEKTSFLELFSSLVKRPDFLFDPIFVDRREELNQINEMIIDVKNMRGSTLLIEGDAGIGKSRLVGEANRFIKKFMKKGTLMMVTGQCDEHETIPYKPLVECLRSLVVKSGVLSGDMALEGIDKWGHELSRLLPEIESLLVNRRSASDGIDSQTEPSHEKVKQILYQSVAQFLKAISEKRPIIIFIDSLQWSDAATLDMFRALVYETANLPLLLIGAYRPYEFMRSFFMFLSEKKQVTGSFSARRLSLSPLKKSDIMKMVQSMLGSTILPVDGFIDKIAAKSDGNPFFIEEILKSSLEEGKIYRSQGKWHIENKSVRMMTMPNTIRELIVKRLQHLEPMLQQILEYAAVLGRVFDVDLLTELMNLPEKDLLNLIDELVRNGILVETESSNKEKEQYAFQHALTRDILSKRVPRKKKMLIHQRIADYFEEYYQNSIEDNLDQLAHHYLQSKNKAKALKYVLLAAEKADRIFANDTALDYLEKALKIVRDEGETFQDYTEQRIMRELARIMIRKGDHKGSLDIIKEAITIAEDHVDFTEIVQLFKLKGAIFYRSSDYVKSLEFWEKALVISEKMGDNITKAQILDNIGLVCLNLAQYKEAEEYIRQSLTMNEKGNYLHGQAYNQQHLGTIFDLRGHFEEALVYFENSLEIMKKLDNKMGVAESLNAIGSIHSSKGHFLNAASYHDEAHTIAEPLGIANLTCSILINHGVDLLYTGQYSPAFELMNKGHKIAFDIEEIILQIKATGFLSTLYHYIKRTDEAYGFACESLELIKKSGNRNLETWILGILGTIQLSRSNYDEAQKLGLNSLDLAESIGDSKNQLLAIHLLMIVQFELFRNEEAIDYGNRALKLVDETGNDFIRMVTLLYLSNLHLRKNDPELARKLINKAEKLYVHVSARDYKWRISKTKARLLYTRGKTREAIENLIKATKTLDSLIKEITPPEFRQTYHNDRERLSLYSFLIALLIDSGRAEEAVQYLLIAASEELRGFLFNKNKNGWNGEIISGILSMERTGFFL